MKKGWTAYSSTSIIVSVCWVRGIQKMDKLLSPNMRRRHLVASILCAIVAFLLPCISAGLEFDIPMEFKPAMDTMYAKVTEPTLAADHLDDLPGFTRSTVTRDHALITPESQVFQPLLGWQNALGAHLVTPALGAHFTMYLARMAANSSSAVPVVSHERFVFVVRGEVSVSVGNRKGGEEGREEVLGVDMFAYFPPEMEHALTSVTGATVVIFERMYFLKETKGRAKAKKPRHFIGTTAAQPILPVPGEVFKLRKLLPQTAEYDFNMHVMDFEPGEYLNVKEVHYNQHGLLLLEGRGIYRLANDWYPVQAGDAIWMAPFVPQWYAALGKTRSRYLLYKDTNRDPADYF